jgi:hypothetical protein
MESLHVRQRGKLKEGRGVAMFQKLAILKGRSLVQKEN